MKKVCIQVEVTYRATIYKVCRNTLYLYLNQEHNQ